MKFKTGWAFVLLVVLAAGSVLLGAHRGWSNERARVDETYAGLESMLQTRVESAYNVLAVARRHVDPKTDDLYKGVENNLATLESTAASLPQKAEANEQLAANAAALLSRLAALDSVRQDDRDKMYVESYLPQMLSQSEEKTVGAAYNQAAKEFNGRMKGTVSGWIARMMGVKPAEEFIVQ